MQSQTPDSTKASTEKKSKKPQLPYEDYALLFCSLHLSFKQQPFQHLLYARLVSDYGEQATENIHYGHVQTAYGLAKTTYDKACRVLQSTGETGLGPYQQYLSPVLFNTQGFHEVYADQRVLDKCANEKWCQNFDRLVDLMKNNGSKVCVKLLHTNYFIRNRGKNTRQYVLLLYSHTTRAKEKQAKWKT